MSPPPSPPADLSPATFSLKATLWRIAFAPFLGLGSGMLGGAIVGLCVSGITLAGNFWEGAAVLLLGAFYLGPLCGLISSPYAAVTGLAIIPLLPFLRRGKLFDAAAIAILAGVLSYFVALTGDQPFSGGPEIEFLSPRIAASMVAAGTCVFLLGRGDDRRFAAAITSSTTLPRRRSAAYWRKANRG